MSKIRDFFEALGGDHSLIGRMEDGVTIAQHKNVSDDVLEGMYAMAYGHYQSGKYQDAHDMFLYLCLHDHTKGKFLAGMGAACFRLGKKEQAEDVLKNAVKMDTADPGPALNLAHVYEALGEPDKARTALGMVISRAKENKAYQPLQQVAEAMLQNYAPDLKEK